jgi:hypothetical protein
MNLPLPREAITAGAVLDQPAALRVAVLLPCFNEEAAIAQTIAGFRASLPDAVIYVYDNNSSDRTREIAASAGAVVRTERMQGKGHVVRRMFADVDADVYVMADGDATYEAEAAPALVRRLVDEQLDMVVGARRSEVETAYRRGHRFGNKLLTGMLARIFGRTFTDILSGYRVFSRRFAKSFPALARGFETETEITVHALELAMPVAEVVTLMRRGRKARSRSSPPTATAGGSCRRSFICSGSSGRCSSTAASLPFSRRSRWCSRSRCWSPISRPASCRASPRRSWSPGSSSLPR